MTTDKFTPGPWTAYHPTGANRNLIGDSRRMFIADVWTSDRPDAERCANASLIAEAPAMLAALRAIVQVLDGSQPIDVPGALMVARSALAKTEEATR